MRSLAVFLALMVAPIYAAKPFDVAAMMRILRISDPQLSPDGKTVAYAAQTVDLATNQKVSQIYLVPTGGGSPKVITDQGSNDRPRWTPDGKQIVFVSTRSGASQIWMMYADGVGPKQVSNLSTEASGVSVFPDGKRLLFVSEVYPDCPDDACNKARIEAEAKNKVKARIYTKLLYRHWTAYQGKRRSHLLTLDLETGTTKDITPGVYDVPTFSLGGPDGYAISPDAKEVAFVMNNDADQATSTNSDIFVVPSEGGELVRVSNSPGSDVSPLYSPDGQWLAYRSQKTAGYESDRWRLLLLKRSNGQIRDLTSSFDRNVNSMFWSPDSTRVFFTVEDRGRQSIQMVSLNGGGGARVIVTGNGSYDDVQLTPDGKTLVYSMNSGSKPTELFRVAAGDAKSVALTKMNDALLAEYDMPNFEEINAVSADGSRIASFILKPAGFSEKTKYPVLFLIHGGPQGAWHDGWSFRWNPQIFAAAGFIVVMPNPRGSTGYGQKFTDEINSDWGGKVYEDIMATVDFVGTQPWGDADRFAAAGGSYGGYMVNWMLGHNSRFKALVSHAGVFDLRSMAGETEEVWFPMWEFRGMPWENPDLYQKLSPSSYVSEFRTPTLVIHGDLDYRVPVGQGLQLFTSLQMRQVPSKLLMFPDEGHWVLKPQNSELWYRSVLDWVTEWTKKAEPAASAQPPLSAPAVATPKP